MPERINCGVNNIPNSIIILMQRLNFYNITNLTMGITLPPVVAAIIIYFYRRVGICGDSLNKHIVFNVLHILSLINKDHCKMSKPLLRVLGVDNGEHCVEPLLHTML